MSAEARSHAYRVFAGAFGYPEGALLDEIQSGALRDALGHALGAVSPTLEEALDREALRVDGDADALAAEYTRLFDVGTSGPPCPLHGGLWVGDRMKTMEEVLRFYRHFGLTVAGEPGELPDHLALELEFLHYLAFRAHEAGHGGGDVGSFVRAERDFVARHPGRVVPLLRAKLEREKAAPFYRALLGALDGLLAHAGVELAREAA
jgi:DMSO reductase family type II enzyme chaperone